MKKIKVLVADEIFEVADRIKNFLKEMNEIEDIKIVTNEEDLYKELINMQPDILFLDLSIETGKQIIENAICEKLINLPYLVYTDTEPVQPSKVDISNIQINALIKPYYNEEIERILERYKEFSTIVGTDINKKILKLMNFYKI